ncbi:sister chromatid cohesion 1 protein 2 isoform X1 [Hevea brasiliensis]|nr:sister chromatid cohesion 1 protein 2 isoform X1 [Hevea brasiliensis]
MFYSHCFLSRKGPLGAIWVAAYCFNKLKKAQITQTDISSSVDKILQDEFDVVTYRVLAYLLLGIVRIFSKKVEYLFNDCNKVLLKIKEFLISNKDMALVETLRAPYFSITVPERFELDAFDLEILEDTTGDNVLPHEEITLKDGIWKTSEIVPYSLAKYHCDEFTACQDIFSMGYTPNEDILSSHLMGFDMGVGTSSSAVEASIKKLQGSSSSLHEPMDLEMFTAVEEEPPDPVKTFGECQPNKGEHTIMRVLEVVDSGEMHAESNMLWHNSICQEACLNNEIEVEEEPENPFKSFGKHHQTDGQMIKVPDMAQSENENLQVIKEDDLSNIEASVEKLRDIIVSQEECRDVEIFCVAEPSEHGGTFNKEHQCDAEQKKLLEIEDPPENSIPFIGECQNSAEPKTLFEMLSPGNRTHEVFTEDNPLSVTLDTTPQSKFPDAAGDTAPEFLVIPTPAAKEGARFTRKRKCLLDDAIVFPNNVIKQYIEDPSNLVCKRKKIPHTVLAAWRAHQVSSLPQCFLEPLIPCASLELRSLFCLKKLKISESLDTEKLPEKFMSECPTVGRPVESVETIEKLDESKSCINGRTVETMKSLEKLNVSASPTVDRLNETAETPKKLDIPPTAGRSLEEMSIAPETPVLQTKSLRSFESPEISNLDRVGMESARAQKEVSPSREQELDLNLMNEETNLSEGHNQDHYGWSERTRVVERCLHRSFLTQKNRKEDEVVNLLQLLEGRTTKESARFFYEILVLKSKGCVHVKQENAYGDILIWKASQWGQVCGANCAGTIHFLQES